MNIEAFTRALLSRGVKCGSGVPCSFFGPLFDAVAAPRSPLEYLPATSEGEAVAIAAGLTAGGRPAFALMQNSGLGNAVNPLTSMLDLYRIPVLLFVSHRGAPSLGDEPQHRRMGRITDELLRLCGVKTQAFDPDHFEAELDLALQRGGPTAWIVSKGALKAGERSERPAPRSRAAVKSGGTGPASDEMGCPEVGREEALRALAPVLDRAAAVVSTNGKLSRELYELDRGKSANNRFYMVGSMGCAASFGLGISRCVGGPVLVLDGDGSLLMKLGSLATVGHVGASTFHHILFDNGVHESTGGQPTASSTVDFASMALAAGYARAQTVDTIEGLGRSVNEHLRDAGPTFVRMRIKPGSRESLGRPTLAPEDVYRRFSNHVRGWASS